MARILLSHMNGSRGEILWPVVVFEIDDYPRVIQNESGFDGLYEDDYWDEVAAAFDSNFVPIDVQFRNRSVSVRAVGNPDPIAFESHGKRALIRNARLTRWRRVPASSSEEKRILALPSEAVLREIVDRFRE